MGQRVQALDGPRGPGLDRLAVQPAAQVVGQLLGGPVPLVPLLLEALEADRFQIARDLGIQAGRGNGLLREHLQKRGFHCPGAKRRPAGQLFVKQRTQGIDVCGRTDLLGLAAGQLGCHVAGRAEDRASLRQALAAFQALGQPEVRDFGLVRGAWSVVTGPRFFTASGVTAPPPAARATTGRAAAHAFPAHQQDIGGFEVAVNDALLMRVVDGAGQGLGQLGGGPSGLRHAVDVVRQGAAFHKFHGEKGAVLVAAHLENLHDIRMTHLGNGLGFIQEAHELLGPGIFAGQYHLQGDEAVERQLPRLVDDAHAAPAQLLEDLIAGYLGRGGRRRRPRLCQRHPDGFVRLRPHRRRQRFFIGLRRWGAPD